MKTRKVQNKCVQCTAYSIRSHASTVQQKGSDKDARPAPATIFQTSVSVSERVNDECTRRRRKDHIIPNIYALYIPIFISRLSFTLHIALTFLGFNIVLVDVDRINIFSNKTIRFRLIFSTLFFKFRSDCSPRIRRLSLAN